MPARATAEFDVKPHGAKRFTRLTLFLHLPGKCVSLAPFSRSGYGKRFPIRRFPQPQQIRQTASAAACGTAACGRVEGLVLETPLIQIGHTLTELNCVDAERAQALYYLLPVERLAKKARSESLGFQRLGTLISQLVEVDTSEKKMRTLLQHLGVDYLVREARHSRFEEISAGLQDIGKCDMVTAKAVLNSLDFRALEVSARVEQFEKLCPGLKRLALIDVAKADSLLRRFSPRELAQSASHLRVDLLASCLSDLAEVNAESARLVLKSVSVEIIAKRLASLNPIQAKQALARFENVDRSMVGALRRMRSDHGKGKGQSGKGGKGQS
jgi:hypothetical protein